MASPMFNALIKHAITEGTDLPVVSGGSDDGTPPTDPPAPPPEADPPAPGDPGYPDGLGDAGKKALDAERAARRAADQAAKDAAAKLKAAQDEIARRDAEGLSDAEKAIAEARKEAADKAREEVTGEYEQRLLDARVLAKAAGKLADATDATRLIDLTGLERDTDGQVSDKTIDAAIASLVKNKPYLATGATPGPGSGDGGARGGRPNQLTQADLKTMTSEQIVEAKAKGQLDDLLGRT